LRKKKYYENNKEIFAVKSKKYRDDNRTQILEDKKKYYHENKIEINNQKKLNKQTEEGCLNNLIHQTKQRNKKLNIDEPYDIDIEYLYQLIKDQESKCIYCKHKLIIKQNSNELSQISIDRILSSLSYKKSNIQLICLFCNLAKSESSHDIYDEFIDVLTNKREFDNTNVKINKNIISQLVSTCRKYDIKKEYDLKNIISTTQIRELLKKQNNKCLLTGINFVNATTKFFPYKMSVDRIDNTKGHTLENCQLVCMAINLGKLNKSNEDMIKYIKEIREINK